MNNCNSVSCISRNGGGRWRGWSVCFWCRWGGGGGGWTGFLCLNRMGRCGLGSCASTGWEGVDWVLVLQQGGRVWSGFLCLNRVGGCDLGSCASTGWEGVDWVLVPQQGGWGGVCMCVCGLGSCASTQAVLVACMKLSFQKSEECLDCLAIRLKESLSSIHLVCS